MNNNILDFIGRRFPPEKDCNWISGNCYYFAVILASRFEGEIWYHLIDDHFVFKQGKCFYDWTGLRQDYKEEDNALVKWDDYKIIDPIHYGRIKRDVIE